MARIPYIQFYPGDWLRNEISGCSLEAQGLWLRMIIVMHDSDEYGQLSINGEPMPDSFIARKCGISLQKYRKFLKELEDFSVINRKKNSIIYSGRMRADHAKRLKTKGRVEKYRESVTHVVTPEKHATRARSSSSSSSSSLSKKEKAAAEDKNPPPPGNAAIDILKEVFPYHKPSIFQQDSLNAEITDFDAWESAVRFWGMKDYKPSNISGMMDIYKRAVAGEDLDGRTPKPKETGADYIAELQRQIDAEAAAELLDGGRANTSTEPEPRESTATG